MKLISGADLVNLFGAMHGLDEFVRFASVRSATTHALDDESTDTATLRDLLRAWMKVSEPATPIDARPTDSELGKADGSATESL